MRGDRPPFRLSFRRGKFKFDTCLRALAGHEKTLLCVKLGMTTEGRQFGMTINVLSKFPPGLLLVLVLFAAPVWAQRQPAPYQLTLTDAITRGLKANLNVLTAATQVDEAAGTRERRLSTLLPHVTADHDTALQNRNLAALGITVPFTTIPQVVGPFSTYDYRVSGSQTIVDRQAYHALKASERQQDATKLTYDDTRDLIARQVAGLYLDAQVAQAEVQAAESRLDTSKALAKLAHDQHENGLATGIDTVRSQVQVQRDQQSVLVARDSYETSVLNLERFIGMRPGEPVALSQRLGYHQVEIPEINQALATALQARADYRSLASQREALVEQQKASHARYLPKLSVDGNYGPFGRSYGSMPGIGLIEGVVFLTVFDRDRKGEQMELASRVQRIDDQIADLRRGIEQELRKAVLDLQSAEQQVSVTQAGVDLAERELGLAKDRFKNGLSDNIEVVTAQSSLQSAQDDNIAALARHADAAVALARTIGATQDAYQKYRK
jgi:outer membrane protein TolC